MLNVVILGFDQALASAITGVADLLALAGVSWNRIQNLPTQRLFNVKITSHDGKPFECINGLTLCAHLSFAEIENADVIVVPTIGGPIMEVLEQNQALIALLQKAHKQDCIISGNCTGNFLLAQAGILDGKPATTHWGYKELFEQLYPNVHLKADQLITKSDNIYCSGGGHSWFDFGLHLIERKFDYDTALQSAKSFVLDYRRDSQLSYSIMGLSRNHKDSLVQKIQNWLDQNYAQPFNMDALTEKFNVSKRTLIRRFNTALDMPPNRYVQAIRMDAAQKLLEETQHTVDVIMLKVGYEDASSFRRLFRKKTGLTPTEYRSRFSRRSI